jgi:glutamate/tyrosine decarboxylase-like PLP-dependent enzyme
VTDDKADHRDADLDPTDWAAFRAAGRDLIDRLSDYLETVRDRPIWREVPAAVRERLAEPAPADGRSTEEVLALVDELILPYNTGNIHPRFFGWVHGTGTPDGMLAELVAAAMNSNVGGRDHGAIYVERQVIDWFRTVFGLPDSGGGLLVSGTSMANLIGLTVARDTAGGAAVREDGLTGRANLLVGYTSARAHGSVQKAFQLLGLGSRHLRRILVDENDRVDVSDLRRTIDSDLEAGHEPFCIVGTAGTVGTGAFDDIEALADLCAEYGLWLHVDGAFGALLVLSDERRPLVAGIERADSIGFDFHKWLHVPFDAGCILVRDRTALHTSFAADQVYMERQARGLGGGDSWPCDYGPELSRGFRALKVWVTVQRHGLDALAAAIDRNCRQAAALAERIDAHDRLELMASVMSNIVCFRYVPETAPGPEAMDELQREIVTRLQESGVAVLSTTRRGGRLAMRAAFTNQRTEAGDLAIVLDAVESIAADILSES